MNVIDVILAPFLHFPLFLFVFFFSHPVKFIHGRGLRLWKSEMSPTQESMEGNEQTLPQGTGTV